MSKMDWRTDKLSRIDLEKIDKMLNFIGEIEGDSTRWSAMDCLSSFIFEVMADIDPTQRDRELTEQEYAQVELFEENFRKINFETDEWERK